jgi:hypothetical protein
MTIEVNKILIYVAVFTIGLGVGGYIGTDAAQKTAAREKAELQQEAANAHMKLQDEYRAKEQQDAKKLSEAIAERDQALADLDASRADLDRVRKSAEQYRRKLSRATAGSASACKPFVEKLSRCTVLLEEGTELLDEGSRLSGRIAADKDALAALHE